MGHVSRKTRLRAVIAISFCFFIAEISVGFYTHSIALVADAFHYLNDLIGFIVALVAVQVTERKESPQDLTFGWTRAQLLGAFFNGAFLLALGLSIALQSIERFVSLQHVENPKLVLIVGCIGLALNLISAAFLHEHDHGDGHGHSHGHSHEHEHSSHVHGDVESLPAASAHSTRSVADHHLEHLHLSLAPSKHGMDLGILGVLIHILGDAINNIGVIIAALIIWLTHSPSRFYADPAVSMWIAIMILISAIPLTKRSGKILLQSAPLHVKIEDVKHDLESIPGVLSVHELHVWRLDQRKAVASAHVVVSDPDVESFMKKAKVITECLHAYGIHSVTLQPELPRQRAVADDEATEVASAMTTRTSMEKCGVPCGTVCEELKCCK
ncbi:cation efflux system protein czcD [Boeremia exigua]|uniref:cation efflux system protein czcD n=1 Tax=Boeremia exigua TaxID=749465 RepID=UPI001E8CB187|nr:cation efflux system protein czcD [Boeremia exigua]KAH6643613.1 cation efflux system protein czcD [Boeremia exigua]